MPEIQQIGGTINGTGAALRVGIGFIPDWVRLWNLESTAEELIEWDRNNRSLEMAEGVQTTNATTRVPLTFGNGIAPYRAAGASFATAQTAYVVKDTAPDKRASGTGDVINAWTLGSSTNRTGNWNAECNTTYVGEGSKITIKESVGQKVIQVAIVGLTSNGEAANEVILSESVKSGEIVALSGMYDFLGIAAGVPMRDGFLISEVGECNETGEMMAFRAGRIL